VSAKKETDPNKQNKIYQEGLEAHPKSFELFGNYALFLTNIRLFISADNFLSSLQHQ
jgi:hypothetical protein